MNEETPKPGQKYRHFRGGTYEVIAMATDAVTHAHVVVYRSLEDESVWTRSLNDWLLPVGFMRKARFTPLPEVSHPTTPHDIARAENEGM